MKYSEYLQLRELLEEKPELNEGILGTIGTGVWNLAKKGMAKAISAGLSEPYKEKLNKSAEEIKQWAVDYLKKAKEDEEHPLYQFINAKGNKNDKILDKQIARYIKKNVERQSQRILKDIESAKMLEDDDKENMKDYWDELATQIELSVAMTLGENKIVSDDEMSDIAELLGKIARKGEPQPSKPQAKGKPQPSKPQAKGKPQPQPQKNSKNRTK